MVTGSGPVTQLMIDDLLSKGVKTVANWYGMTEQPPPVFVGYNSEQFDFTATPGYTVEFTDAGECVINGFPTGDLFDVVNKRFLKRIDEVSSTKTWKHV
jgi:long-subunit acyl-CoA synthetase (AMP-forming)